MRLPDVGALLGSGGDRRVVAPAQLNLLEHQGLLDSLAKLPQPASNPAPSDISAGLQSRAKEGRSAARSAPLVMSPRSLKLPAVLVGLDASAGCGRAPRIRRR